MRNDNNKTIIILNYFYRTSSIDVFNLIYHDFDIKLLFIDEYSIQISFCV